jgi:hypothetical protein
MRLTSRSEEIRRYARDEGDARRTAHNPEVAGSNPAPATKSASQRPLPIPGGAFLLCLVHRRSCTRPLASAWDGRRGDIPP